MVNNKPVVDDHTLDAVFSALSDSTRRGMLAQLAHGSATVGELGRPFDITKGAVSKHIKVLERSGLLRRSVDGRIHRCDLDPAPLDHAEEWLDEVRAYWEARFTALAGYLETLQRKKTLDD